MLNEISQIEKDKHHMFFSYTESLFFKKETKAEGDYLGEEPVGKG
jgi:hypothetical protein